MRTITVTVTINCSEDSFFDHLSDGELVRDLKNSLLRGWPLLRSTEIEVRTGPIHDSEEPLTRQKCDFCGDEALHTYGVVIDGTPVLLSGKLCQNHGDRYLIRHGILLGTLKKEIEDVFTWLAP